MSIGKSTGSDPKGRDQASDLKTRVQAAAFLGVKPQTLASWQSNQRYGIPIIKVGRLVRYRTRDLEAWLDRRTLRPDAE